jgi:polyferredoxin
MDRLYVRWLFHADQNLVGFDLEFLAGPLGNLLDVLLWCLYLLFAGHMREQVCKHMCPYARFQGVMFDPDTLTITYDTERGEPRGARKKGVDPKAIAKGIAWTVESAFRSAPPESTSGTVFSTSASAVQPALTPAIR